MGLAWFFAAGGRALAAFGRLAAARSGAGVRAFAGPLAVAGLLAVAKTLAEKVLLDHAHPRLTFLVGSVFGCRWR